MFLDQIVATKQKEVALLSEQFQLARAEAHIASLPRCRGFEQALTERSKRSLGIIAEVKKASPSKGLIRADFHPVSLAKEYEEAGVDCISVLTDVSYFQGANAYLTAVHESVSVPLLRKDFIIDHRQVYEARAIGADAILLIAAILTKDQMKQYQSLASDLGMDVLVEVHDERELQTALELETRLIGINNRNLKTFHTDLATTERLIEGVPVNKTIVSESGISSHQDVRYLQSIGTKAILVGEHLMRQPSVKQAVYDLMGDEPR